MKTTVNMDAKERILSAAGGASLLVVGVRNFKKSSIKSWAELISGSIMVLRGVSGYCPVNHVLRRQIS